MRGMETHTNPAPEARRIDGRLTYWTATGAVAAGKDDRTNTHSIYHAYDADCSYCWLGYSHTEACHAAKLATKQQAHLG